MEQTIRIQMSRGSQKNGPRVKYGRDVDFWLMSENSGLLFFFDSKTPGYFVLLVRFRLSLYYENETSLFCLLSIVCIAIERSYITLKCL